MMVSYYEASNDLLCRLKTLTRACCCTATRRPRSDSPADGGTPPPRRHSSLAGGSPPPSCRCPSSDADGGAPRAVAAPPLRRSRGSPRAVCVPNRRPSSDSVRRERRKRPAMVGRTESTSAWRFPRAFGGRRAPLAAGVGLCKGNRVIRRGRHTPSRAASRA